MDAASIHSRPAAAPATPAPASPAVSRTEQPSSPAHQGTAARDTFLASLGLLAGKKVFDSARIVAAYPRARAEGQVGRWVSNLASQRATNDVVPIKGGEIRMLGMAMHDTWGRSLRLSNMMSIGLSLFNVVVAVPNLVDGYDNGGLPGLSGSRSGRMGLISTFGMGLDAAIVGISLHRGLTTGEAAAGQGLLGRAGRALIDSPLRGSWPVVGVCMGIAAATGLNAIGYLDMFNVDEHRSAGRVISDRTGKLAAASPPLTIGATTLTAGIAAGVLGRRSGGNRMGVLAAAGGAVVGAVAGALLVRGSTPG